jgi:hypothetical protein
MTRQLRVLGGTLYASELRNAFQGVGPLASVDVSPEGASALVTFADPADAERAARSFHMSRVGSGVISVEIEGGYLPKETEPFLKQQPSSLCVVEESNAPIFRARFPLCGLLPTLSICTTTSCPDLAELGRCAIGVYGISGHGVFDREALRDMSDRLYSGNNAAVIMLPASILYLLQSCPKVDEMLKPQERGELVAVFV